LILEMDLFACPNWSHTEDWCRMCWFSRVVFSLAAVEQLSMPHNCCTESS
jgi:hypothetical protein